MTRDGKQVLYGAMERVRHHLAMRETAASRFVGDESPRRLALELEKPAKEPGCDLLVSSLLGQDVEHSTVLVNGSIEKALLSVDTNKDFINEPLIATGRGPFA